MSDSHRTKHSSSMISTVSGIRISWYSILFFHIHIHTWIQSNSMAFHSVQFHSIQFR
jgi:hypothetical protein